TLYKQTRYLGIIQSESQLIHRKETTHTYQHRINLPVTTMGNRRSRNAKKAQRIASSKPQEQEPRSASPDPNYDTMDQMEAFASMSHARRAKLLAAIEVFNSPELLENIFTQMFPSEALPLRRVCSLWSQVMDRRSRHCAPSFRRGLSWLIHRTRDDIRWPPLPSDSNAPRYRINPGLLEPFKPFFGDVPSRLDASWQSPQPGRDTYLYSDTSLMEPSTYVDKWPLGAPRHGDPPMPEWRAQLVARPAITNVTLELFTLGDEIDMRGGDSLFDPWRPDIVVTLEFRAGLRMGQLWDLVQHTQGKMTRILWPAPRGGDRDAQSDSWSDAELRAAMTVPSSRDRKRARRQRPRASNVLKIYSYRIPPAPAKTEPGWSVFGIPVILMSGSDGGKEAHRLSMVEMYTSDRFRGAQSYDRFITGVVCGGEHFNAREEEDRPGGLRLWHLVLEEFRKTSFAS
ncbi:hypothetical protein F5X99DRAFT_428605, partial [Biscogniauxia marginata]